MGLIVTWLLYALCLYLTALIVPSFTIKSFGSAMIVVLIIGFLNMFLTPILTFLTLPLNIITLGLFTFVVNAVILRIASGLSSGLEIKGWIPAIIGAVVLAFLQALIFNYPIRLG